ncbi:MAG TPA: oligosaccharide flippase family protein [Candidatus Thermoplasmatota archaeon]|nr:oligosaccharide flippase family protein [Candidatus Thermoplasmatota archaeon]
MSPEIAVGWGQRGRQALRLLPRGALPAVLSRGSNAALAFLSTIIIARVLVPSEYGVYSLAVSALGLLALAGQLGFDALTPRSLGIYAHDKDWPHAFSFMRWTTKVVVGASILAYAAATLALTWNPMRWDPAEVLASRILLLGLPFVALLRIERSRLQAFDKTALGLFFELPFWNTLLLASGVLLFLVPALRTSAALAALHALTFAVAFLAAHLALRRQLPPRPARLEPAKVAWARHGASFTVLAVLGFLLNQGDVLLVGTFLSQEDTAHFSVAVRSAGLTLIVLQPLQQVVAPRIAKAWSRGDRAEATRLARRCGQLSLLAGVPMALFFWLGGPFFLQLFGGEYDDALWALRWLSLAQVLYAAAGPGSMVMQMIHEEKASIGLVACIVGAGLPLTALLAWKYGIAGAAAAKVLTLGAASVGACVFLRVRKGIDILPWSPRPPQPTDP